MTEKELADSQAQICVWTWDDNHSCYETSCDKVFTFNYSSREKEFKFCPYCGGKIKEEE